MSKAFISQVSRSTPFEVAESDILSINAQGAIEDSLFFSLRKIKETARNYVVLENYQYKVFGSLVIDGALTLDGQLAVFH